MVVRKAALETLSQVMTDHLLTQQEPLLQHIVIPYLKPLPLETNPDLRCQAVQMLMKFLPSPSATHTLSLLEIVSKVRGV